MDSRRLLIDRGLSLAALAACGLALGAAAQRLPANPPTAALNQNSVAPPISATATGENTAHHHRARVMYANGLLDVRADNSSLNQILREISRDTGMKIIGGVADQRVFGNYGPAPAGTVLQTLLDGTNTNMLLQEDPVTRVPEQLVLTPRTGGVTPPGPSSASYDVTESEPEMPLPAASQPVAQPPVSPGTAASAGTAQPAAAAANNTTPAPSTPPSMPQPANNVLGSPNNVSPTPSTMPATNSIPVSSLPTPSTAQPVSGIVDAPNPPPAASTTAGFTSQTPNTNPNTAPPATSPATTPPTATQTSPTAAKTPAEVYQELLQLQQQKAGSPANPQANPQGSSAPH
jgi:hypothetical protein